MYSSREQQGFLTINLAERKGKSRVGYLCASSRAGAAFDSAGYGVARIGL